MKSLEGEKAPAFNLEGNDGKKHAIEDYKGKTVVLYFYPKDDTPGCTKEACGFRDLGSSLKKSDAVVLGVSKDGIESHNKFAGKYKLPFTLLSDPKTEVMKKYGAFGKKNDVRQRGSGDDSFDGGDRAQGRCDQALAGGEEGRGASGGGFGIFENPFVVRPGISAPVLGPHSGRNPRNPTALKQSEVKDSS